MPLHLDTTSPISEPTTWNNHCPTVQSMWGMETKTEVKLFRNPVWCRDQLMFYLRLIAKEITHPKYPEEICKPFIEHGYKNLLCVFQLVGGFGVDKEGVKSNISMGIDIVNDIERQVEKIWDKPILRTKLVPTDNKNYLVLSGSKFWKLTTMHASLWTMILRTVLYHDTPKNPDLAWVFKKYCPPSMTPLYHYHSQNGQWMCDMSWDEILPYMIPVLAKLKVTQVSSCDKGATTAVSQSGILSGFYLGKGYNLPYTNQIKQLLLNEMKAAGDPNAEKIPT